MWKRMAEAKCLPPPKSEPPKSGIRVENNYGIAGERVHIENLTLKRARSGRREVTPGLVEADPDMRTYATYLVKRYTRVAAERSAD